MLDLSQLGYIETEIVELPIILDKDGNAKLLTPAMKDLPASTLSEMAKMMGGSVGYVKLRAQYSNLEVPLCIAKGCTRLAHYPDHKCETHTSANTTKTVKL